MTNKFWIVAKNEYLRTVKKPLFWVSTLFFPAFIFFIGFISAYSAKTSENKAEENLNSGQPIYILDESSMIQESIIGENYKFIDDKERGINLVKNEEAKAFIYYPEDILESKKIEIYSQNDGIIQDKSLNNLSSRLLKQSIITYIPDEDKQSLYNSYFQYQLTTYQDGEIYEGKEKMLILAGIGVVIYIMMMIFGSKFMLTTISEEKENRLIEIILTCSSAKNLIIGKVLGSFLLIITQLIFIVVIPFVIGKSFYAQVFATLPINLDILDFKYLFIILFYVLIGFGLFSAIMVAVGAAAPNAKEAGGLSSPFIILSILPVYVASIILTDPSGSIAQFFSYFPFSAPMILLFRNIIGELSTLEFLLSSGLLIVYLIIAYWIAFRLFELGAMEFQNRISIKKLFRK